MVDPRYYSAKDIYKIDLTTPEIGEQRLLDRLALGDRYAFWSLWELYRDYLYYRCLGWMDGNHNDAEEVMSLASLKAWDKLPNYAQNITNLKGWLHRFTHNLCIDIHRQRKYQARGVENVEAIPGEHLELVINNSNYSESSLLQQELKIYLRYGIDSLSSRLRAPLILSYYQDMSYADIAQQLAISEDNVAKRIQQAKQILKQRLRKYFAGLNTEKLTELQCQELEQKDFSASINIDRQIEEIDYRVTISCLENLPPVWFQFQHH